MRNSSAATRTGVWHNRIAAGVLVTTLSATLPCHAQLAEGFAVERFVPAAPGARWLVLDDLALSGPLGAGVALTLGYARNPLRVTAPESVESVSVVSDQVLANVGLAVFYDRFRFTLDLPSPIYITGHSATLGEHQFIAPAVNLGKYPDKIVDVRFGVDTRLWGDLDAPLRLGLGTQFIVPTGETQSYVTDGTYRAQLALKFAGQLGPWNHAAFIGVHVRPRDDSAKLRSAALGGPRGSELVFGLAAAPEITLNRAANAHAGIGTELIGATTFHDAFGKYTTALEALLSAHFTRVNADGATVRAKVGAGPGLNARFGAPEWRMVLGLEISDRAH
jgi:hypothetical protein